MWREKNILTSKAFSEVVLVGLHLEALRYNQVHDGKFVFDEMNYHNNKKKQRDHSVCLFNLK